MKARVENANLVTITSCHGLQNHYTPQCKTNRSAVIRRLALAGLKPYQIREITGDSFNLIYHNRRKLGLAKVAPPKPPIEIPSAMPLSSARGKWAPHMATIRLLKQQGASYRDIGNIYGVTRNRIQQLLAVEAGDKCEKCGSRRKLNAHHKDYLTDESETLCVSCHRGEHGLEPTKNPVPCLVPSAMICKNQQTRT